MREDFRSFMHFTIAGLLTLFFVFAGKYDRDELYIIGIFMYMHLNITQEIRYRQLKRRLKKYQKGIVNSIYGIEAISSANRTDTDNADEG